MAKARPPLATRTRSLARGWSAFLAGRDEPLLVDLPWQWQTCEAASRYQGPVRLRRAFSPPAWHGPTDLVCGGAFYRTRWILNGTLLGTHEGYTDTFRFPIEHLLREENLLEVEVACPPETDPLTKTQLLGIFSHWDCLPPHFNPGGIWRPVWLEARPAVRVDQLWLETEELGPEAAQVQVHARLQAAREQAVQVRVVLRPLGFSAPRVTHTMPMDVGGGFTPLKLPLTVPHPRPWQPREWTGRQRTHRYRLELTVLPLLGGRSHRAWAEVGLRMVGWDRHGRLTLNGRPFLPRGMNYGPSHAYLSRSTAATCARDVEAALRRGVNAFRVHAHVDHPALYREADRRGLVLFQDGPLQWRYRPDVLAASQGTLLDIARNLLAHPSVVAFTLHNEPVAVRSTGSETLGDRLRSMWQVAAYSDNRDREDQALAAALRRHVPAHALVIRPHSGVLARRRGEDSHLYMGWYPDFGPLWLLDWVVRVPLLCRWVTEFGAQSLPSPLSAALLLGPSPTPQDWQRVQDGYMAQPHLLLRHIPPGASREEAVRATQAYQWALLQAYVGRLRRWQGRHVQGFFAFLWRDAAPGITWSLVDAWGRPKEAFLHLKEMWGPVAALARLPLRPPSPHRPWHLEVDMANATPWPLKVYVQLTWHPAAGGEAEHWQWEGVAVPPLGTVRVARLRLPGAMARTQGRLFLRWRAQGAGDPLWPAPHPPTHGQAVYLLPWPVWDWAEGPLMPPPSGSELPGPRTGPRSRADGL